MPIKRNDPVREAFAACSSGNIPGYYYETKGHALRAFDAALADFGYHRGHTDNSSWSGDSGRYVVGIYIEGGDCVGCAVFSYYRMDSGRWEFIGYLT
jgi:hypothetical protein